MEYFSLRKFRIDCCGRYYKICMIMRLTTILLFATVLQVSAKSEAQTITLSGSNISLVKALTEIKNQSKYAFFWSDRLISTAPPVNVQFKNYSLKQALDEVLKNMPLSYKIEDKFVYIIPEAKVQPPIQIPQQPEIHGKVTDSANHPIAGVSVIVKGTTRGTITSSDGDYKIAAKDGDVLKFDYVGYKSREITVHDEELINVVLENQSNFLNDEIVVGYSTQRKKDITAAISTVTSKDLESSRSGATISAGLAGKAPGISFLMQDSRPGATAQIQIRNYGTPIYIIDGVKQIVPSQTGDFPIASSPFNNLAPGDIESITFLKDASAAIYGVEAANGVVLITTKKGKAGGTAININVNNGWQNWTRFPKMANNYQWQEGRVESYVNQGQDPSANGLAPSELAKYKAATTSAAADTGAYRSFDWYKFIVQPGAPQANQSINFSGGSDKINFYTAVSHLKQYGLFNVGSGRQFWYERTNLQANVEAKVSQYFKIGSEINGTVETRQNPGIPNVDDYQNSLTALYLLKPWERPYANDNPDYLNNLGNDNSYDFAFFTYDKSGKYAANTWTLQTNIHADWQTPVKGLSVRGLYSYYYMSYLINNQENIYTVYNYLPATQTYEPVVGSANPWRQRDQDLLTKTNTQLQVNYQRSFGKHNIQALFVNERISSLEQYNFVHSVPPNPQLTYITFPAMDTYTDQQMPISTINYVGTINYNYEEKYYLQLLGSRNASYVLSPGHKFGNFPAITGGWRISNESFFKNWGISKVVNNLKLNASYGITGDDRPIAGIGINNNQFRYLNSYTYNNGVAILDGTAVPISTYNGAPVTTLTWESAKTLNIGLDFGLFDNKLDGSIEYFHRLLYNIPAAQSTVVPVELGYDLPQINQNSQITNGVELNANYSTHIKDVGVNISGNISYARWANLNEHQKFNNSLDEYFNDQYQRGQVNWGYVAVGQFKSQQQIDDWSVNQDGQGNRTLRPGDIMYKDLNGDGILDSKDTRPIGYGTDFTPLLYGGMSFSLNWKGLDFRMDFSGGTLYSFYLNDLLSVPYNNQGNLLSNIYASHWHHEDIYDPNSPWIAGKFPSLTYNDGGGNNYKASTFWNINVWYIKCRNVELGYNLPKKWLAYTHFFKNIRAYLNVSNLFSLDNTHQYGIDPEASLKANQWVSYPALRVINVGANITL